MLTSYRYVGRMTLAFVSLLLAAVAPTLADAPDLSALHGRVIYLDFWASWCGPCRQSFPWMNALRKRHEAEGLTIIAVNVDHDKVDAERFLKQFQPDFQVSYDPDGKLARQLKVEGMPTSFIIDRKGTVRFTHVGFWPADGVVAEGEIRELLAEPAGGQP